MCLKHRSEVEPKVNETFREFFFDKFSDFPVIFQKSVIFRKTRGFGVQKSHFWGPSASKSGSTPSPREGSTAKQLNKMFEYRVCSLLAYTLRQF